MVHIIAEIGVNHQGDVRKAVKLIEAAAGAGADAVKFQLFDAEKLEPPGERRDMLEGLELSREQILELMAVSNECGLKFICTPFDVASLKYLADIGCDMVKIGSADFLNRELVSEARKRFDVVLLSTGIASQADIVEFLRHRPGGRGRVILMHCTSAYPCPLQDVNLLAVESRDGFSDHTTSTVLPAAAVAMGATYIEKHLTLHRGLPGPDHLTSLEPDKFREMVQNIREVEVALGDGIKRPMPSEAAVMKVRDERAAWRAA